jgi:hypothetical protein
MVDVCGSDPDDVPDEATSITAGISWWISLITVLQAILLAEGASGVDA